MTTKRDYEEKYKKFFIQATRIKEGPYPYQIRLATDEAFPELLDVPTGLGKTAAVVLAWLWRRRYDDRFKGQTPRRLVYCLPMRVLVEQTQNEVKKWIGNLVKTGLLEEKDAPNVHLLMGGEVQDGWVMCPGKEAIIIGTQDMLLSRALMRGYAAGRARWPIDFGLLNNDCFWVFDEVQLMSTGLATSLQLDAWRKVLRLRGKDGFLEETCDTVACSCRSLWMSATMARHWLDSAVDWMPCAEGAWSKLHCLTDADFKDERIQKLFAKSKAVEKNPIATLAKPRNQDDKSDVKAKTAVYINELADAIMKYHSFDGLTLVILNTVDRAIALYSELRNRMKDIDIYLIHSRFRPMEREKWKPLFAGNDKKPRVIISTQVIEAGIDISARVLFTELAPWAALAQRFGRCARFIIDENGKVYWMDIAAHDSSALPYSLKELKEAETVLRTRSDVGLKSLKQVKDALDQPEQKSNLKKLFPYDPRFVPRDKDLFDLFDTTPDLTGADVDVSRFIRDDDEMDVQVFWRVDSEKKPLKKDRPDRRELCPVAFYRFREQFGSLLNKGRIWRWTYRDGWELLSAEQRELIYPGQIFLLDKSCGGYHEKLGWTGKPDDQTFDVLQEKELQPPSKLNQQDVDEDGEELSLSEWLSIADHTRDVCREIDGFSVELFSKSRDSALLPIIRLAARWHDRGKAHQSFVAKLKPDFLNQTEVQAKLVGQPAAKAPGGTIPGQNIYDPEKDAWRKDKVKAGDASDKRRPGFRHELASALAILETLHITNPEHAALAWPEGLDKSAFGRVAESRGEFKVNGHLTDELADLSVVQFDLLLYLVASHHGKVRMSLRNSPDDSRADVPDPCPPDKRQARGVRDFDPLPAHLLPKYAIDESAEAPAVTLNLDPMELGLSTRYGPSWRERMQGLLERLGPFRLAYLESLLRIADWRASEKDEIAATDVAGKESA